MVTAGNFFSKSQKEGITEAIRNAELDTSGEIRVHIENSCKEDVLVHAAFIFEKLKMHQTAQKNGVLFYLSVIDHQFAILGDAGINSVVPENFWDEIKEHMLAKFKEHKFTEGLCEGIAMAGKQLKAHFPYHKKDTNELSNEMSF